LPAWSRSLGRGERASGESIDEEDQGDPATEVGAWVVMPEDRQELRIGHGTVWEYVSRASGAGLSWERSRDGRRRAGTAAVCAGDAGARDWPALPTWTEVHQELRRKGVTLALLWQEYKEREPAGLQYSRYCDLYRKWKGLLSVTMRQEHRLGRRSSSTTAGQRLTSSTRRPARYEQRRSSSQSWERRMTPTPRPRRARTWRTGSARTCGHSSTSAVSASWSSRTTPRPGL